MGTVLKPLLSFPLLSPQTGSSKESAPPAGKGAGPGSTAISLHVLNYFSSAKYLMVRTIWLV